jgi:hypothetical protein
MPDLEEVYADAMAALPTSPDYDAAEEAGMPETARRTYAHGSLPLPPPGLASGRIIVLGGTHSYPSLSVDFIQVHAHRETYRALGLFVFAGLLAPGPRRFELALTHPDSQVRRIILDTSYRKDHWAGLLTEPREIAYLPAPRSRHPLQDVKAALHELPAVSLTDPEGFSDRDWPGDPVRDTLMGFGGDVGAHLMGELLLDISQAWNETAEYELEGPYGFGGVAPSSAEIRFWLPGGFGWVDPAAASPASTTDALRPQGDAGRADT